MPRKDKIIIEKILREINIGMTMLGNETLGIFLQNEMMKRALAMTVINVGELVKNISDQTRGNYPHIPWKAIAGMRDIAAHKYQTLRMEDVYNTVQSDFPHLSKMLEHVLQDQAASN